MPDVASVAVRLCNASGDDMLVWLEPWTGEFRLPQRAELLLDCVTDDPTIDPTPELDVVDDMITVWGAGGSRIAVFIDGVDQESFSAEVACPDMGPLTPRKFVEVVFGRSPAARPGGSPLPKTQPAKPKAVLARLFQHFGFR